MNSFSSFIYSNSKVYAKNYNTITDRYNLDVKGIFIKDVNNLIGLFSDVYTEKVIIGTIDVLKFIF